MGRKHRKPRKPFDWMTTYQGRRGTLQLIQKAIEEGWLNGPEHAEHRKQLVADSTGYRSRGCKTGKRSAWLKPTSR